MSSDGENEFEFADDYDDGGFDEDENVDDGEFIDSCSADA